LTSATIDYPARLEVQRQASQSRLTNFPLGIGSLIRTILLIPHLVILYLLQIVASLVYFFATFAILFTGSYPAGMFNFYVGYMRWTANVYGYLLHLCDRYPPFSLAPQDYPVSLAVVYPPTTSRWLNFPLYIGLLIKMVLAIPHLVILAFLYIAVLLAVFMANFAILITGSFPEEMHKFVVDVGRWWTRVNAYLYGLTDAYPPFLVQGEDLGGMSVLQFALVLISSTAVAGAIVAAVAVSGVVG
jgi:hypothetical protein